MTWQVACDMHPQLAQLLKNSPSWSSSSTTSGSESSRSSEEFSPNAEMWLGSRTPALTCKYQKDKFKKRCLMWLSSESVAERERRQRRQGQELHMAASELHTHQVSIGRHGGRQGPGRRAAARAVKHRDVARQHACDPARGARLAAVAMG